MNLSVHSKKTTDEINHLLQEAEVLNLEENPNDERGQIATKEESLEKLLEEIIGSVKASSAAPPPIEDKIPSFLFGKEKLTKPRLRLIPLALSLVFLGGIFMGTIFGFYWGKNQSSNDLSFEALGEKIGTLSNEVKSLRQTILPDFPSNEIIQPIEPPEEREPFSAIR